LEQRGSYEGEHEERERTIPVGHEGMTSTTKLKTLEMARFIFLGSFRHEIE
jgi:hypothetical protein